MKLIIHSQTYNVTQYLEAGVKFDDDICNDCNVTVIIRTFLHNQIHLSAHGTLLPYCVHSFAMICPTILT